MPAAQALNAAYIEIAQEAQANNQKEIEMRQLTMNEMSMVSGAGDECSSGGNNYGGVTDTSSLGADLVEIYEGLVEATSHVIERIANAL